MTELGQFAQAFASWKVILAPVKDVDRRMTIFGKMAQDVAGYIVKGLDRASAVDELHATAQAHGLVGHFGEDAVQQRIAEAFAHAEAQPKKKVNGKSRAPAISILCKADFIKGFVPPDYLVDGIFQRRFIYALTGQTGHAKTAVALHLAELVSSTDYNAMFGLHRVEKGRVLYLVGENPDDVRMRVIGSDSFRKDDPSQDNITFIPGVFDIAQMWATIEADVKANGEASLVIIDTSAAYFLGNEELSNTQMGGYARTLRRLTTLSGKPCVLVLCHPIKYVTDPSQLLPRGGGAYLAEMDGNLTLWRTSDDVVELHYNKIRGPGFQAMSFKLEPIKSDKLLDQKGRQISTVRAVPISQREEEQHDYKAEEDEDRVLAAMLNVPADHGGSFANWANDLGWTSETGEAYKKKVERLVTGMEKKKPKLTTKIRNKWQLTDEGKDAARQAVLRFNRRKDSDSQKSML
jgi:hypothetical protein